MARAVTPFPVLPGKTALKAMLREIYPPFIDFSQPVPGITEIFDSASLPART